MVLNKDKRRGERLIVASRLTIEDIFQCWLAFDNRRYISVLVFFFASSTLKVPHLFQSDSGPIPVRFRSDSGPTPVQFHSDSCPIPVRIRSDSGLIPSAGYFIYTNLCVWVLLSVFVCVCVGARACARLCVFLSASSSSFFYLEKKEMKTSNDQKRKQSHQNQPVRYYTERERTLA